MQDFETGRPGRAFAGQVVLVSGARQGIGAAIARAFIAEGARIAALVHKPEQAQEVEDWLASAGICVTADVTNEGECRAAVRECEDQLGACNVLVNAAGIAISKKFVDTDEDTWRRLIDQGARPVAPEEVAATRLMPASETGKSISGEAIVIGRGT